MSDLLKPFAGQVVSHSTLLSVLDLYKAPNFKIHSLLKAGRLISLKRGLYAVADGNEAELSLNLVANHIYGPSYVSLEFMLSYYGIIPEFVPQVTSVTIRRGKVFENKLGRFSYQHLPPVYYSLGISYVKQSAKVAFMVASQEKSVCDWLVLTPNLKVYSTRRMRELLLEDMRMDDEILSSLDIEKIKMFAGAGYKTERLNWLIRTLEDGL